MVSYLYSGLLQIFLFDLWRNTVPFWQYPNNLFLEKEILMYLIDTVTYNNDERMLHLLSLLI